MGNRRSKYTLPNVSLSPIGVFLQDHRALVEAVRGPVRPVSLSPRQIGQLIDDGPRYFGSSDG